MMYIYIPLPWLFAYLAAVNLIALCMVALDKRAASRKKGRRIPEHTLLWTAVLGGSPLLLLCMCLMRHKTKQVKFMLGVPLILVVQAVVAVLMWRAGMFPGLNLL